MKKSMEEKPDGSGVDFEDITLKVPRRSKP